MDFIDPSDNFFKNKETTGYEPVLGGQLAEKAVWVDEAKCIGCQYCVHVASNTFMVDEFLISMFFEALNSSTKYFYFI